MLSVTTAIAGQPVSRVPEFFATLDRFPIGAVVGLTVQRGGQYLDLEVTLQPAGSGERL